MRVAIDMTGHDMVVIGASAGGVEALLALAEGLPADLPAAIFVVVHIPPSATSALPMLLGRRSRMPAVHPADGMPIEPGRIYVAPPDRHLLVDDGVVRLGSGPRENGHRPAVDPLFRSAARSAGSRVVGVVLSGNLDDGADGLRDIRRAGGVAVAQSPVEALYPSMPESAITIAGADYVLPVSEIGPLLAQLARTAPGSRGPGTGGAVNATPPAEPAVQMESAMEIWPPDPTTPATILPGPDGTEAAPSGLTCPECHGALWEMTDGGEPDFRCRVGHRYTQRALLAGQAQALDVALWTAYRALTEHAGYVRRLVARLVEQGNTSSVARLEERARDLEQRAAVIRGALARGPLDDL